MDNFSLIVTVLLVGGTLFLVLTPLRRQTMTTANSQDDGSPLADAEARYQAILQTTKELIFDHEMGKVSTVDYEPLLSKAKLEAAQIRRQIDLLSQAETVEIDPHTNTYIEDLVSQMRQNSPADHPLWTKVSQELDQLQDTAASPTTINCAKCGIALRETDQFCRQCGQSLAETKLAMAQVDNACPDCGFAIQPDDAFCAQCGTALSMSDQSPS